MADHTEERTPGVARSPVTPTAAGRTGAGVAPHGVDGDGADDPRRWLVLITVLLGQFMIISAAGAVNIALPSIRDDLESSPAGMQWVLVLYQLGFAVVLITGGRLGDIFGRRRVFMIGLVGFVGASLVAALAPNVGVLMAARLLQGVAGGLTSPQVLAMIQTSFSAHDRPKAFAAFGMVNGSAFMIGLLISGAVISLDLFGVGWRSIFYLNVLLGGAALAASAVVLPVTGRGRRQRLDVLGTAMALSGTLLVLYPLVQGRNAGWPPAFFVLLALAVPVLFAFVRYERRLTARDADPLVNMRLFRARSFRGGLLVMIAFSFGTLPTFFVITVAVQEGLGYSPLKTALTTAPTALAVVGAALLSARLVPRYGRRLIPAAALLGVAAATTLMATITFGPRPLHPLHLMPGLILQGANNGVAMTTLVNLTLADVSVADAGSASGLFQTVQQSMAAVGIAIVGIVFFGVVGDSTSLDRYVAGFNAALAITVFTNLALLGLYRLLPATPRWSRTEAGVPAPLASAAD